MTKIGMIFLALVLLSACSTMGTKTNNLVNIRVIVSDPDRIRFSGKGAGAGMMLSSSMGPMGIAIGVAIDEGIGKDIDSNTRKEPFDIREIFKSAFQQALKTAPNKKISTGEDVNIIIDRYGFVAQAGDNDPVVAQLHVTLGSVSAKFPEEFTQGEILAAPLDKVKTEADLVRGLYRQTAVVVSEYLIAYDKVK